MVRIDFIFPPNEEIVMCFYLIPSRINITIFSFSRNFNFFLGKMSYFGKVRKGEKRFSFINVNINTNW